MSEEQTSPAEKTSPAEAAPAADTPANLVSPVASRGLIGDVRASLGGMIVVLVLVAVQQGAWLLEPAVFGQLLNAVTSEARTWVELLEAMPMWVVVFAVNTAAGALRRIASDRVYTRMYARVAEGLARRALESKAEPQQTAALSELGRDFVSFFEDRVPEAITDFVSLIGATGALFVYDPRIGAACLGVLVPALVMGRVYSVAITKLTTKMHELREGNVEVFSASDPAKVLAHFTHVADLKRSIGIWSAGNQVMLRLALLIIFVVVLYVAIDVDGFQTGDIYSIVTYLWTFVTAIETLPEVLEHLTAVRDLRDRLSGKAPVASTESSDN